MADETKVKLPQDLTAWSIADIEKYIAAHLPGGHKRRLAEEILRLRKLSGKSAKAGK